MQEYTQFLCVVHDHRFAKKEIYSKVVSVVSASVNHVIIMVMMMILIKPTSSGYGDCMEPHLVKQKC